MNGKGAADSMKLYIDAAYESIHKNGQELCGDRVDIVRAGDEFFGVLADGLGSGVKANILATLTSKIIVTMMTQGASLEEVVETIANTLPVCKDRGIAYSTFTILNIKPDGELFAAEFDNPYFLYFRGKEMQEVDRTELTIEGKSVFVSRLSLRPGDVLVTFSDGVVHAGVGRLLDLGWQYENIVGYVQEIMQKETSPRMITKRLLQAVNALYMNSAGDDSTVLSLRICESRPAVVMVGPPIDPGSDTIVVQRLLTSSGKKIVCGGTTSQIVSRVSGRPLDVQIDYDNPALPPTAKIPGVDLVTEGVLTLRKCLDIIKGQNAHTGGEPQTINYHKKDGATLLTKALLEDTTETVFLVGRALNPAHQNPGMPISLGLKLGLINDLAEELRLAGKKVTVEYY